MATNPATNCATSCLVEAKQRLERAMRTRGLLPTVEGRTFNVKLDVGRFSMSFLPGNRRIVVFHDVFIEPSHRGKGIGRKWLRLREEMAREAGCNLLQATVRDDNATEVHLLQTEGWRRLIDRRETGVSLWVKRLRAPTKRASKRVLDRKH